MKEVYSELDKAYGNVQLLRLLEHPGASKDIEYIKKLKTGLAAESIIRSQELVIGVWARPYGGPAQIAGYAYYTKDEARRLVELSKAEQFSVDPFFGGFYDGTWFDKRIESLQRHDT